MAQGLMRKLTLDISGVMKSIDDLQKGLANLGKGGGGSGNGNLTIPGLDALKKQLTDLSTQIKDVDQLIKNLGSGGGSGVGSGGGGGGNGTAKLKQDLKEVTDL